MALEEDAPQAQTRATFGENVSPSAANSVIVSPRWAMVGAEVENGVMIFASEKLGKMELEAIRDEMQLGLEPLDFIPPRLVAYRFDVPMEQFTLATGKTWREAFLNLMGAWSPDGEAPLELPAPSDALSS